MTMPEPPLQVNKGDYVLDGAGTRNGTAEAIIIYDQNGTLRRS